MIQRKVRLNRLKMKMNQHNNVMMCVLIVARGQTSAVPPVMREETREQVVKSLKYSICSFQVFPLCFAIYNYKSSAKLPA